MIPSLRSFLVVVIIGILILLIHGCYYDVEEELYPADVACDTSAVTYSGFVVQTLESFCYVCHNQVNGPSIGGGVVLEGYNELKTYVDNGKFIGAINHETGFSEMPRGGSKLTDCTINKIETWVSNGALNN
jgi:hypothetical protein